MENSQINQLLRDASKVPTDAFFEAILYEELLDMYKAICHIISEMNLSDEWRYYQDGKSWLWKITAKKKTMVWISLWENYFKSSFYFSEKHRSGIETLHIDTELKIAFANTKPIGKLIPLVLELKNKSDLDNFQKLIDYKLSLK